MIKLTPEDFVGKSLYEMAALYYCESIQKNLPIQYFAPELELLDKKIEALKQAKRRR